MQELTLVQVFEQIEEAFKANDLRRVEALLWPAVEQFPDIAQFWFYGGCVFFQTGRSAVAAQLFRKAIELEDGPHIYSNLGACLRRMNLHEEGILVLSQALDRDPNYAPALVNLGSMFVNEGCPNRGIPFLEKALKIGTERGAGWNLALLYLEAGRFGEGFDLYRQGIARERMIRKFSRIEGHEPELLPNSGDFKDKTLLVWGEQGIGDELMFGTMLERAREDFAEVILEGHPRLTAIHEAAHPGMRIFSTRKEEVPAWYDDGGFRVDYKCGIGDLGAFYRREPEDFVRGRMFNRKPPYAREASETTLRYRESLLELSGGKPVIGLATRGGVMQTARQYRTLKIEDVAPFFEKTDALFVALDYDDMTGFATHVADKYGADRYRWFPSIVQHYDYVNVAELLAALDLTVTVCQSVAHLAGGMGAPVRVLTPQRCAWRYTPAPGFSPETWYWYPETQVKLYRQTDPDSWAVPIQRAVEDIQRLQSGGSLDLA